MYKQLPSILDERHSVGIIFAMTTTLAKPFVKWAGGKQSITDRIVKRFPAGYKRYFEPFLGGGSVLLSACPTNAIAGDSNEWLIQTYMAIRDNWPAVAANLDLLPNTKEDYLRIRKLSSSERNLQKRAAYFIYLNKTCFRGLYRVNRNNQFNVPYGDYSRRYYDPENLNAVSEAIKSIELKVGDFELTVNEARKGDFIYFDPPYFKLGGFSDFNRYTPEQFREAEHLRLSALCRELDDRGVMWLLSNSDTHFVKTLYEDFNITEIESRREINLNSAKRTISELLISNY